MEFTDLIPNPETQNLNRPILLNYCNMSYLICSHCGEYYQLEEDESPEDFDKCHCGGTLYYSEHKPQMSRVKFYGILSLIFLITLAAVGGFVYLALSINNPASAPTVLASDYRGSVSKEIITSDNDTSNDTSNKKTVAVITGMHPREKLSIRTASDVVNHYNLSSNQAIVHYIVNVTNNPENYFTSRENGEGLVSQYVIDDIKKSNIDLVIICHDHAPGYGRGYFIATPKMDSPSVAIGEYVEQKLPEFTYYRSSTNARHGSSTITVSNPLASAGIRTLVYEMPEWAFYDQAYEETKKLLSICFQAI
ncbi:MAG: hypothetical protein PWQ15_649 [Methanobacterium sp.]|jgi:hypothetical protein|nr:hypothetical protein [Methanobacterium sp.]CDG65142.1 putative membrane protein [Methanobacterium sp. MB1]